MRGEQECANIIAIWNANGDEEMAKEIMAEADILAEENAR